MREREFERERERVDVNSKRVCFDRSPRLNSRSKNFEVFSDSEVGCAGSFCFFYERVLAPDCLV